MVAAVRSCQSGTSLAGSSLAGRMREEGRRAGWRRMGEMLWFGEVDLFLFVSDQFG